MDKDKKEYIALHLSILKQALEEENLIFGIAIDKNDANNSKLVIVDKDTYLKTGKPEGISVSLTELNKGLL